MNSRKHRSTLGTGLMVALLVSLGGLAGCGHHVKQAGSEALVSRLDQLDRQNAEQKKLLKEMSVRITELENLVLKQKNELKKVKVAVATTPTTLAPEPAYIDAGAGAWEEPAISMAKADVPAEEGPGGDEEPRPLLKLHGTTSAPAPIAMPSGPLEPASLMADAVAIGGFVPLKLETTGNAIPEVGEAVSGTPPIPEKTAVDPFEQGVLKYQAKEWSNAILYFDIYLKHQPKGPKVMNALFLKAESLYQMKKYLDAIGQFELVLERYPSSKRAADASLRIGRCYEKLGDKSKASSIYKSIVTKFPNSKQAGKAGKLLAALE